MGHFLKLFGAGEDSFEGIKTETADNTSPILEDASVYTGGAHMRCDDH